MPLQIKKARLPLILCFSLSLLVKGADTHYKKATGPAPLDFIESESVIKEHIKVKKDVLDLLLKFADEVDGLVIEQIEEDITEIKNRVAGRVINIFSSGVAIAFAVNPVLTSAGITIGYIFMGGSRLYEMKCSKDRAENLESIKNQIEKQLDRYTDSQKKVFEDLDNYEVFEHGKNFEENLAEIKALVREAEKQSDEKFSNMKNMLCNLEIFFNNLDDFKKEKLNSECFLSSVADLLWKWRAANERGENDEDIKLLGEPAAGVAGAAVVGLGISTPGNKPAWLPTWQPYMITFMHGLNIVGNMGFLIMDINEYIKLNRDWQDWHEGGEKKQTLLGNSKFDLNVKMKTIIHQIRDKMNADGY